jgi:hypothetical protein
VKCDPSDTLKLTHGSRLRLSATVGHVRIVPAGPGDRIGETRSP